VSGFQFHATLLLIFYRKHVLDDLEPYTCTLDEHPEHAPSFGRISDWENHLMLDHSVGLDAEWHQACPLCTVAIPQKLNTWKARLPHIGAFLHHMKTHMEEISLAALPAEHDDDSKFAEAGENPFMPSYLPPRNSPITATPAMAPIAESSVVWPPNVDPFLHNEPFKEIETSAYAWAYPNNSSSSFRNTDQTLPSILDTPLYTSDVSVEGMAMSRETMDPNMSQDESSRDYEALMTDVSRESTPELPPRPQKAQVRATNTERTTNTAKTTNTARITYTARSTNAVRQTSEAWVPPSRPKLPCPQCDYTARGEHELRRHIDTKHTRARKMWICVDISPNQDFLKKCKHCTNQKQYGAYYNAAAHLRRAHFNKKPRGKRPTKDVDERGERAGTWPSMEELKKWMKEIEVSNEEFIPEEEVDKAAAAESRQPVVGITSEGE